MFDQYMGAINLLTLQKKGQAQTSQGTLTAKLNQFGGYDYHLSGRKLTERQVKEIQFWF